MATYVGKSIKRKESFDSIQGKNTYIADVEVPGLLHAAIVRSPYAHARVTRVDLSEALAQPGVVAAMSGEDVRRLSRPMAPFPFTKTKPYTSDYPRVRFADHYCLAVDRVRHVGEAVAVVVSEDRYAAADAAEAVRVEYEALPPVVDVEAALERGSTRLYEEWPDNVPVRVPLQRGAGGRAAGRVRGVDPGTHRAAPLHRHADGDPGRDRRRRPAEQPADAVVLHPGAARAAQPGAGDARPHGPQDPGDLPRHGRRLRHQVGVLPRRGADAAAVASPQPAGGLAGEPQRAHGGLAPLPGAGGLRGGGLRPRRPHHRAQDQSDRGPRRRLPQRRHLAGLRHCQLHSRAVPRRPLRHHVVRRGHQQDRGRPPPGQRQGRVQLSSWSG